MKVVPLGESGLRVSRVGLGCNNFGGRIGADETRAVVEAALEAGITFFDTAQVYGGGGGSERLLGELLEGRREEVVIASKFAWEADSGGGAADNVRRSLEGSLERLRTDYVDLYYLHRPDATTPIEETLGALDELVRDGRVRAIGCSNFSAEQLRAADRAARDNSTARFSVLQNQYSLLRSDDENGALPVARELRVSYVPYFPLASGLLTGKYRRGESAPEGTRLAGREIDPSDFDRIDVLRGFAEERARTLLELAIAALASMPGIDTVISGATKPEQVRANAAAADWELSEDDLAQLAAL